MTPETSLILFRKSDSLRRIVAGISPPMIVSSKQSSLPRDCNMSLMVIQGKFNDTCIHPLIFLWSSITDLFTSIVKNPSEIKDENPVSFNVVGTESVICINTDRGK
jgi:hypothetical protein